MLNDLESRNAGQVPYRVDERESVHHCSISGDNKIRCSSLNLFENR
jgi:hypothetical protein